MAGGAGRGSGAAFATSSPLSWQGEEGQIGPVGLNSSEGPKVSAGDCRCVPWFPTGCPHPCAEGQGCDHPVRDLQSGSRHPGDSLAMLPREGPQPLVPSLYHCTHYGHVLICQRGGSWMSPLGAHQAAGDLQRCPK